MARGETMAFSPKKGIEKRSGKATHTSETRLRIHYLTVTPNATRRALVPLNQRIGAEFFRQRDERLLRLKPASIGPQIAHCAVGVVA